MGLFSRRADESAKVINAYRRLFSTEDGQIVLKDLARSCFMNRSVIGKDANDTYFNEGARSVILRIFETSEMSTQQVDALVKRMREEDRDVFMAD
jgi:DNA/RNA-binding domain of Phe-tRNA-synthetase-like protein